MTLDLDAIRNRRVVEFSDVDDLCDEIERLEERHDDLFNRNCSLADALREIQGMTGDPAILRVIDAARVSVSLPSPS